MPSEQWRPVPGWEQLYEVSDLARVRSLDRTVHQLGETRTRHGQLLSAVWTRDGQLQVSFSAAGRTTTYRLAVLVLRTFVGEAPPGCRPAYANDDPGDCRLANLRWAPPPPKDAAARRHPAQHAAQPPAALVCHTEARAEITHWSCAAEAWEAGYELAPCSRDCRGLHTIVAADGKGRLRATTLHRGATAPNNNQRGTP
ncbi:NUMOD4 domain-containing protein [Mycobacterium sp. MYCO198283]|uniref:NUMOD4 domain-containing protein n=1 Tax=Mycobacterium sp. MYCO198283 TaxID=2883505 RepID=UPI001E44993E|nr:NUMOD4 domain-containing protein [Mycobacterium sp. MYCO198283]MCG5431803.1 NUMOD4 domain-containing protein [Mycobacterium sp. MYCO198283]